MRRSPRWGCPPRRCGVSTWPARGSPSKTAASSCTRCWRSSPMAVVATATCRCGRGGRPDRARSAVSSWQRNGSGLSGRGVGHRTYDGSVSPDAQTGVVMMLQVRVLGVALDAAQQHIVLLKPLLDDPDAQRVLPIWIGAQEATSIVIAVAGEQAARPLSHDLMITLLDNLQAQVVRVEVTRSEEGT